MRWYDEFCRMSWSGKRCLENINLLLLSPEENSKRVAGSFLGIKMRRKGRMCRERTHEIVERKMRENSIGSRPNEYHVMSVTL